MPYDENPVFRTEEGHCRTSLGETPSTDVTTVDGTAESAVDCKNACLDDMECGGYERHPTTKECKLFTVGNLKGDGTADFTCEVKQYQQMLSLIIKDKMPAVLPQEVETVCTEESECRIGLKCPTKKATDPDK